MTASKIVAAAASGAGSDPVDIDNVFNTFVYVGNATTRNIQNGVDLTEGGLVWTKCRNATDGHNLYDTERGVTKRLKAESSDAQGTDTNEVTAFNSNGYTLNQDGGQTNGNGNTYASWTFRKAKKFFDVVTWSGNGVNGRTISHNLGSVPGMILVKRTDSADGWITYHRGMDASSPEDYAMFLNLTGGRATETYWNNTAPTSTGFTVSSNVKLNGSSGTYVAYLFAHNDSGDGEFGPDSDQDIIKCGSYAGNGSDARTIDLGFEAQWVLVKRSDGATDWWILDSMRGLHARQLSSNYLEANTTNGDASQGNFFADSQGFMVDAGDYNSSGENYIYMAIRRGPLAAPEDATKVFSATAYSGNGSTGRIISSNTVPVVDLAIVQPRAAAGDNNSVADRIRGKNRLFNTQNPHAENTNNTASIIGLDLMSGIEIGNDTRVNWSSTSSYIAWFWRRAPSFFDIVSYTGTGSNRTVSHNLGVEPEMMWIKRRDGGNVAWIVYHKNAWDNTQSHSGNSKIYDVSSDSNTFAADVLNYTAPTSSVFSLGTYGGVNGSSSTYMCYLWASVTGVSKLGSYTGNGSSQNIDCGFSSGARFVLIKRTDTSEGWKIHDSVRGIVAGNDPFLELNNANAENTSFDLVDPYSSGFAVNNYAGWNASGGAYIFYAIA